MRNRRRSQKLRKLVLQRIHGDPHLLEQHRKFAWTRFWFAAGWWGIAFLSVLGGLLLLWVTVLFGFILVGIQELGEAMGTRTWPKPSLPPLFAGWSLLILCFTMITALRIRGTPVANSYKPWAVIFPVRDSKIIAPLRTGMLLLVTMLMLSLGAFVGGGVGHHWSGATFLRIGFVVILAWWNAWMLAEWIAKLVPLTPLVTSVSITSLIGLFILAIACTAVPRETFIEVNYFENFGIVWSMPPAGWLLGMTGLIEQPYWKQVGVPIVATLFAAFLTREFLNTLVYQELGLGSGAEILAVRRGWVQRWERTRSEGELARYRKRLDRAAEIVGRFRENALATKRAWWKKLLFPFAPKHRDIACLRLLRVNYPRRENLWEFAWGLWPIAGALSLIVLNMYMPLFAMPRFIRIYVALFFALSLFDLREGGTVSGQSASGGYFSTARALFPLNIRDIFRCLLMNRLRFFWAALPGWLVALGLMLQTDLPASMVWNTPLLVLATCMVIPIYSTIALASSNLVPTWRSFLLCLIPWSAVFVTTFLGLLLGVYGSLLAMRVDRAWICYVLVIAVLAPIAFLFGRALELGKFDETVVPTSPNMRRMI